MTAPSSLGLNCAFCAISAGHAEPEVEFIAESPDWVAFFPLDPATPGHTLVIPRQHIPDLWGVDTQLGATLLDAVLQVGRAITASLHPLGLNLISSAGQAAEQTVFHLHLHVVPRWPHDKFGPIWPPPRQLRDKSLNGIADRIRAAWDEEGRYEWRT